jgi:hypothetical protein
MQEKPMAKGRNVFQKSRYERAERLSIEFEQIINNFLKEQGSNLRFRYRGRTGEPDFEVYNVDNGQVLCYFEAEFPDISRWPPGGEWKYETVRWPSRKWEYYKETGGLFSNSPVFLISIREDCKDAYYIDCRIWLNKAKMEKLYNGTKYYGLPKNDPDLKRGFKDLIKYILERLKA